MKILKYLLFTIIVLAILYFSFGLLNPSISYGHQITVDKSVQEAWAVSQDESKYDQWLAGFKSMELIDGEKGEVGSKYKIVVEPGEGQPPFEMIETVRSIKEFDHVDMHFDNEMMDFEQTISFKEEDGKTTIATDSKVIGKSLMTRSMFAMMEILGGSFTAQETENIEALKTLINTNTTDYYPVPDTTTNTVILSEAEE